MMYQPDKIFVTGTDTGVGKTVLSLLLMKYFFAKGKHPFYLKPFQTGCLDISDTDSDAAFIYRNTAQLAHKDPSPSVSFIYKEPKAPHFAALNEGRPISLSQIETVIQHTESLLAEHSPVIIEGAGGLYVPLREDFVMIDLIKRMSAVPVIAARPSLGTINHTLLTIDALRSKDITPAGVVMLCKEMDDVNEKSIRENIQMIESLSGIKVAGVIKHIDTFSAVNEDCFKILDVLFT